MAWITVMCRRDNSRMNPFPKTHTALWLLTLLASLASAQPAKTLDAMIPMRDGVKLHTEVWRDSSRKGKLPFLITRSPYGWARAKNTIERSYSHLADDGYIFIFQDIRGRYGSEGAFVMQRPVCLQNKPKCIDEGTDTYDTIDWLLKNVNDHNGRAGILGISYGGWLTMMALIDPHPALKAASEQASPADMFLGDDFHHKGAFRLSYGYEYASMMETGKENAPFKFDRTDTYDWYLQLGPLSEANRRYLNGARPTWNNFIAHPNYDQFWQQQEVGQFARNPKVPNLNVAGWFDQEDFYGPIHIYRQAEKSDPEHRNYLIVGPWNHGGWGGGEGRSLGKIDFNSNTAAYFREKVQAKWFAYWLKDKGRNDFPDTLAFQTGSNVWKRYDSWPPADTNQRNLYLHANGRLSFEPPVNGAGVSASFISDPAKPVPYRQRPIPATYSPNSGWPSWLTDDQRFVDSRPDVATFQTEPLTADIAIAGDVIAQLQASITGSDADWIVKLIDVYPDADPALSGYQLMVAADVLRGRFRDGFETPKPTTPGEVTRYSIDLLTHNHAFLKGHRIMVQIQSTWFPLIDRNPQKYVANIFEAKAEDFIAATHRIHAGSHIVLPIETVSK